MNAIAVRLLAVAGILLPAGASAGVCDAGCAADDALCRGAQALCETKIRVFETYMAQIDTGRPKYALPEIYQDVLRPHYPQVDLAEIRFAYSDQQPPGNATTDCNQIYFNSESYVDKLRDGAPNPKLVWLLHELAHPEQCADAGGREGYAKRWWDELETAVRESGETVNIFQSTNRLVKQLQALWLRVHDSMPMEQAADAKAKAVLADLERCCLTSDGALKRVSDSPQPAAGASPPESAGLP